jgi:hypothetical protein
MVSEPPLGERRVLAKRKALLRNSQVGVEDNWKKAEWGWRGVKSLLFHGPSFSNRSKNAARNVLFSLRRAEYSLTESSPRARINVD